MPLAVFYHCKLSGEGIPDEQASIEIMAEQMGALQRSGLADAAAEIHVGVNGTQSSALMVASLAPEKAILHAHGHGARSELPTLAVLRRWLPEHADWFVFYHHSKGVTQPKDDFHHFHRRVMERACVFNWMVCVRDLERGYDAVGVNWVDPIVRPVIPGRFFAGNFWWAKCAYLKTLPAIRDNCPEYSLHGRISAEGWIGSSLDRPKVLDYERPQLSAWCQESIRP